MVKIDEEFKALIPPLTKEEYAQLEENILADGCRDPLVLWDGTLVDGHNRHEICTRHGIEFDTATAEFNSRAEARLWIRKNQLGRRNLSDFTRASLALGMKGDVAEIAKAKSEATVGRPNKSSEKSRAISAPEKIRTDETLGAAAGVSSNTIRKVETIISTATPELVEKAQRGEISINSAATLAKAAPEIQHAVIEKMESENLKPTEAMRAIKAETINQKEIEAPSGKFRVLYADPPWSYGNTQPDYQTEQRDHYPVMSMDELCAMPVKDIAADDAVLFLWVTSPILEDSFALIKAWGFRYKASFVWDKEKHNMGHYNSVRHEFLLVCTRGSCQPDVRKLYDSVVTETRTEHSRKPQQFYEMIETIYTQGKKIEFFARNQREGWTSYGYETDKF